MEVVLPGGAGEGDVDMRGGGGDDETGCRAHINKITKHIAFPLVSF